MQTSRAILVVGLIAGGCGTPAPIPALPPKPVPAGPDASLSAVTLLQASKFSDANSQAAVVLASDAHNSRAAAVHAIATYQAAGFDLYTDITKVMEETHGRKFLDHTAGRAAWQKFSAQLDAVDRDLVIVAADPNFSLELCIACWEHDWNHNGRVDDRDRKLFEIEYDGRAKDPDNSLIPEGDPRRRPMFKFDVGDAEWARAMISFQRAALEIILAYRWSELDNLFFNESETKRIVIHMIDPGRVKHARALILAGVGAAERSRKAYLAETDDDREWVPNPKQQSHPMPLEVDAALYETWGGVVGDVQRMVAGEEGISFRALAALGARNASEMVPDAYLNIGAMLANPKDITLDLDLDFLWRQQDPAKRRSQIELMLRNILGNGYVTSMKPSPLVGRLQRMKADLETSGDTLERKLRYLLWLN